MHVRSIHGGLPAALLLLTLAGCGPEPAPLPPPPPKPVEAPAPVVALSSDWRDWPLAPGAWRYLPGSPISSARYGTAQAAELVVQCDAASKRITIMRSGTTIELKIITSSQTSVFPAGHIDAGGVAMSGVILNAHNNFLDAMAFSRGRIAIVSPGLPSVTFPTWAEPARAIEDCRK
jgi:hypothetical protein